MKKICLITTCLCLMLGLCSCGTPKDTSVSSIRENQTMKVGLVNSDSVLTTYDVQTKTYVGVEPDVINVIADAIGVSVTYVDVKMSELPTLFENGSIDLAIGQIANDDNLASMYGVSSSYANGYLYAVTVRGNYMDTFGSFDGSKVGVIDNLSESALAQVRMISNVSTTTYSDLQQAQRALANEDVKAVFCYEKEAQNLIADGSMQAQNIIGAELEDYVILTKPTSSDLLNGVNLLIDKYKKEQITSQSSEADDEQEDAGGEQEETDTEQEKAETAE